jgi:hypothetical protein
LLENAFAVPALSMAPDVRNAAITAFRRVCYDPEALETRKEHKPKNSAINMAAAMGIEILTEHNIES